MSTEERVKLSAAVQEKFDAFDPRGFDARLAMHVAAEWIDDLAALNNGQGAWRALTDRLRELAGPDFATPSPETGVLPPCYCASPNGTLHDIACPSHPDADPAAEPGRPATCVECGGSGFGRHPGDTFTATGCGNCPGCNGTGRATPGKPETCTCADDFGPMAPCVPPCPNAKARP